MHNTEYHTYLTSSIPKGNKAIKSSVRTLSSLGYSRKKLVSSITLEQHFRIFQFKDLRAFVYHISSAQVTSGKTEQKLEEMQYTRNVHECTLRRTASVTGYADTIKSSCCVPHFPTVRWQERSTLRQTQLMQHFSLPGMYLSHCNLNIHISSL